MERNNETSALPPLVFRKYKGRRGRKNEWKAGGEDGIPLSLPCWNILAWGGVEKVLRLEKGSGYHEFQQVHNTHRTQEFTVSWEPQESFLQAGRSSAQFLEAETLLWSTVKCGKGILWMHHFASSPVSGGGALFGDAVVHTPKVSLPAGNQHNIISLHC